MSHVSPPPSAPASPVSLTHDGDIAVLTLDDGKVNALNAVTLPALAQTLPALADAAGVVFIGRPGAFCAGFDLKAVPAMEPEARRTVIGLFAEVALALYMSPCPVVMALSGHTLAGGAVLSLTGDTRMMAEGPHQFGFTEVAVGIPMPQFIVDLGQATMAPWAVTELLLHARRLSPDEAAARGLVEVVAAPVLRDAAVARARELSKLPKAAYTLTKERIRGPVAARWRAQVEGDVTTLSELVARAALSRGAR